MNYFYVVFTYKGIKDGSSRAYDAAYRADKLIEVTLLQCDKVAGNVAYVDAAGELSYYIKSKLDLQTVKALLSSRLMRTRILGAKVKEIDPRDNPGKALHGTVKSYLGQTDLRGL